MAKTIFAPNWRKLLVARKMERRTFLTSTGAIGAGTLLSNLFPKSARGASSVNALNVVKNASGRAGSGARTLGTLSEDLTPYTGAWGDTQLRHLLRRCMFGVPESQFQSALQTAPFGSVATVPMNAIVTKLLACQDLATVPIPAPFATWLSNPIPTNPNLLYMEVQEIVNWWFDLMMQENLSIRQKMTLMWTNHFVTGSSTVLVSAYVYTYLMTCMTNALGNFKTFAYDISIDPAMLYYLNGNTNYWTTKNNDVNENYAREVMELFLLGINFPNTTIPNYTQNDVEANAQALTGWTPTITAPFVGQFNSKRFDSNPKTFLGQTGNWALQDVINIIFQQPTAASATLLGLPAGFPEGYTSAYWACQTIYKEFVYYNPEVTDPNHTVIDAMARLMLNPPSPYNPFDIAPVLQSLLTSQHFYSDEVIGAQIKSPCEYMGSLVREFGLTYTAFVPSDPPDSGTKDGNGNDEYTDTNPTISVMTNLIMNTALGQQLLNPPNVAGWPGGENWLSAGSFQNRQNYSDLILSGYFVNSKKNWNLAFSPTNYTANIPNAGTLAEGVLFSDLEDGSLAFSLGPIETNGLTPNPTKTDDVIDTAVPTFAAGLAQLPEFQLY
jgi:uncharacterized protein (DUF1800 family)